MSNVPNLGEAAARARAVESINAAAEIQRSSEANTEAPQIVQATTAFIVAWVNGEIIITADLDAPIVVDHFPTADEILGAGAILTADRTAERAGGLAGQTTVAMIEQKQQEAMSKAIAAQQKSMGEQLLAQEKNGRRA